MKALISPNEFVYVPSVVGGIYQYFPKKCRVADKAETAFEVAQPLFWVDCADDLDLTSCYYDEETQSIVMFEIPQSTYVEIPQYDLGAPTV